MEHFQALIGLSLVSKLRAKRIGKRIPILLECLSRVHTEGVTLKILEYTTSTEKTFKIPVLVSVVAFRLLDRSVLEQRSNIAPYFNPIFIP